MSLQSRAELDSGRPLCRCVSGRLGAAAGVNEKRARLGLVRSFFAARSSHDDRYLRLHHLSPTGSFQLPTFPPSSFIHIQEFQSSLQPFSITLHTTRFSPVHSLPTGSLSSSAFFSYNHQPFQVFYTTLEQCVPPLSSQSRLRSWHLPSHGRAPSSQSSKSVTVRSRTQRHHCHQNPMPQALFPPPLLPQVSLPQATLQHHQPSPTPLAPHLLLYTLHP
jgi:hypothetical protein